MTHGTALAPRILPMSLRCLLLFMILPLLSVTGDNSLDCLEHFKCQMGDEKRVVTCRDIGIDVVPMCLHPRLLSLSLHSTRIRTLYITSFMYYTDLRYIDLSQNQIGKIESRTFQYASLLEELYLTSNKISTLDSETFLGLGNLTALSLKSNFLQELPDSVFHHLRHLEYLDISHNRITSLAEKSLAGLKSLSTLLLSSNRLAAFPADSIGNFPLLASLSIGDNFFNEIERNDLKGLASLVSLDLSKTNFSMEMPPPDAFQEVFQLRILKLEDCQLINVPTQLLKTLPHLEELYISRNLFKILPKDAFVRNEGLQILSATGCPNLKRISDGALESNINLQQLILSKNPRLTYLPSEDLHYLSRLQLLDLHGCNLQYVPHNLFLWNDVKEWHLQDNPLVCNCSVLWLRDVLLKGNSSVFNSVTCESPPSLKGVPLTSATMTDLACTLDETTKGLIIGLSICGILVFVGCIVYILILKNRSSCIRQLLKGHKLGRGRSSTHCRSYESEYPCIKPVPVTEL